MANLLVEIGNTAVKASWSEGDTIGKTIRYQGERVTEFILSLVEKEKPQVLAIASSRRITPQQEEAFTAASQHLILLDPEHAEWLRLYDLPDHISYDRAASIIAARKLFSGKACTIFDFGTTLTVDFIDESGHYIGGNISLGCRTRFKSLNRYSKNLPLVNTPADFPEKGTSTISSIESGIISGIMFEIDGYIRQNHENTIVFTGGDAIYFAKKMKNSIFVVCNLAMMGLALITDEYVRKNVK